MKGSVGSTDNREGAAGHSAGRRQPRQKQKSRQSMGVDAFSVAASTGSKKKAKEEGVKVGTVNCTA